MDDAAAVDASKRLAWEALCAYRMMAPTEHLLTTVRAAGAAEAETEGLEQGLEQGLGDRAQAVLLRCVDDPVCVQLPPKAEYTQRVLKRAVQLAEAAGCEVRTCTPTERLGHRSGSRCRGGRSRFHSAAACCSSAVAAALRGRWPLCKPQPGALVQVCDELYEAACRSIATPTEGSMEVRPMR